MPDPVAQARCEQLIAEGQLDYLLANARQAVQDAERRAAAVVAACEEFVAANEAGDHTAAWAAVEPWMTAFAKVGILAHRGFTRR